MASKRRNMFHKNKTQETTEKGLSWKTQALFLIIFICDAILSMPRCMSDFIEDPFTPLYSATLLAGQLIVLLNFRVLLDCIAILPQVFMLSKIRGVQLGFFTSYILLLVCYKLCLIVAMGFDYIYRDAKVSLCTPSVRSISPRHRPYALGSTVPVNVDCKRSADFNSPPLTPSSPFDSLPPGVTRGCTLPSVYKPKYVRGPGTEMHNINKEQLKESHLREKVPVYEEIAEYFIPERMEDGRLDSKEGKEPSFYTFDEGPVYNILGCPGYMGDEAIYNNQSGSMNTFSCVGTNVADCLHYPIMTPHAERFPPVDFPTFSHGTFDCRPAMESNWIDSIIGMSIKSVRDSGPISSWGVSWKTQVLFSIVFVCDAMLSMPRCMSDFIEDPFKPLYSFILLMGQLIVLLYFRVLLDCIAILPQVFMLSKIRRVQLGFFTRYFLLLVGYKLCLVVAMVLAYVFRGIEFSPQIVVLSFLQLFTYIMFFIIPRRQGLCTPTVRSISPRHKPYSLGSTVPVNVDCKRSADFNSPPLNPSSPFDSLPPGVTRGCTLPSVYKPKYVRGLDTEMHNINKERLKESHLREKVPAYEEIAEDFIPERMEDGRLDSKEGKEPSFYTFDEGPVYNILGCPGYMGDEANYDKHRGFMNTLVCVGANFADCANYPIMTPHAERFPPVDFPTFSHGTFDCRPAMGSNCTDMDYRSGSSAEDGVLLEPVLSKEHRVRVDRSE
ncbi:hypothetical protein AAG570_005734 [Ranatra chinensis]|uniref:Uncharacterized protein n=1 Tax=Ranatra chinensis TaxID=642074 RepID=A0ABD0YGN6_9HEMI